ncbi:hypothetical protein [Thauera sp. WH-1]|uniref:hypothetical protein n=1 Tax=Thauera sp. WH-1 TaxID=3398230 RepID=UPI0039FDA4BA
MNRALVDYSPETELLEMAGAARGAASADEAVADLGDLELAAELLDLRSEAEFDGFLHRLLATAGAAGATCLSPPLSGALAGTLRAAAKRALPAMARLAHGRAVGEGSPPVTESAHYFGLELEGLSPEDQEFELARSFVRFARDAVRHVAGASRRTRSALRALRSGVLQAASHHAPGLLPALVGSGAPRPVRGAPSPRAGRWVRRGARLIIVDC